MGVEGGLVGIIGNKKPGIHEKLEIHDIVAAIFAYSGVIPKIHEPTFIAFKKLKENKVPEGILNELKFEKILGSDFYNSYLLGSCVVIAENQYIYIGDNLYDDGDFYRFKEEDLVKIKKHFKAFFPKDKLKIIQDMAKQFKKYINIDYLKK